AIPATAYQAWRAKSHHRHGSQPRLPLLPARQTRSTIRRQRHRILRSALSRAANSGSPTKGAKAWIAVGYPAIRVTPKGRVSGESGRCGLRGRATTVEFAKTAGF